MIKQLIILCMLISSVSFATNLQFGCTMGEDGYIKDVLDQRIVEIVNMTNNQLPDFKGYARIYSDNEKNLYSIRIQLQDSQGTIIAGTLGYILKETEAHLTYWIGSRLIQIKCYLDTIVYE